VHVEYDEARFLSAFLSVADAVEDAFPRVVVLGNDAEVMGDALPRSGAFEVVIQTRETVDGDEGRARARDAVCSALRAGRPPSALEVIEALEGALDPSVLGVSSASVGDRCG